VRGEGGEGVTIGSLKHGYQPLQMRLVPFGGGGVSLYEDPFPRDIPAVRLGLGLTVRFTVRLGLGLTARRTYFGLTRCMPRVVS